MWISTAAFFYLMVAGAAPHKERTDVQRDGFDGPVKSVLSTTFHHSIRWRQPDGVALVVPVSCPECEYDPDGARTRFGQTYADGFHGDSFLLSRDEHGNISERRVLDASTGVLKVHEIFGPLGLTEQTYYEEGKVSSSSKLRYDQSGMLTETSSFDAKGQEVEHTHDIFTKEGVLTDSSTWGSNGRLKWHMLYNPETQAQSFVTFDEAGQVKLSWSRMNDKMTSFWERSDDDNQYGACQGNDEDKQGTRETDCFSNGNRHNAVIREKFIEPKSHDLKSAEWSDGSGKLLYAAYYDYDFDSHRNWTRRKIWVISPELPERTLYEEDNRILVYW